MTHRVLKYEATVYHDSTGSSNTNLYTFTQVQAGEVGGALETDGLDITLAQKLCDRWNKLGDHGDIRYSYRIAFC